MVAVDEQLSEEKQKRGDLRFPVDSMHNGIRAAVVGTFLGGGLVGFVGGIMLLPNAAVLAALFGIVTASGGAYSVEKVLRERWPSGREFHGSLERIALSKYGKFESVIDCQKDVTLLMWRFKIKKDSPRAKKGWQIVAVALEQEDTYVIVYSAASPDEFQNMPLSESFTKLERKKRGRDKDTTKSAVSMREAGIQRRLQTAEFARGLEGGDISLDQFIEYIEFLQVNFPQWINS